MDEPQRSELLRVARQAIENEVNGQRTPLDSRITFPREGSGAFVTLHNGKRLRGCMGTFTPKPTVDRTIEYVARLAANDARFRSDPVTADELGHISIEISLLGELQPTERPEEIQIGRHGVMIQRGSASGCFLPQVAVQNHWDVKTLLEQCCSTKAKLPSDAWNDGVTEILRFTAEVFAESPG